MHEDDDITPVSSGRVRCTGDATRRHGVVELVVTAAHVVRCPLCGRRFRRAAALDRTDPAVWPKGD